MKKRFFLPVMVLALFNLNIMAQVTIGSDQIPNKGSLLDLKEDSDGSSKRGLGLPRVVINSYTIPAGETNLALTIEGTDAGLEWDKDDHIGLVVYNVGNCTAKGVYVWDGNKWLGVNTQARKIVPPGPAGAYAPNCYLYTATTAGTITIPVEKAFAIWDWWGGGQYSEGQILPETSAGFTGSFSVEVLWQTDANNAESTSIIAAGGPTINSTDITNRNAIITVPVTGTRGNALIALKDGNGIRWNWHIWVTDDPTATTYTYDTGFQVNTWMDRNLGATATDITSSQSYGMSYQWGRKDPFPASMFPASSDNPPHPSI